MNQDATVQIGQLHLNVQAGLFRHPDNVGIEQIFES